MSLSKKSYGNSEDYARDLLAGGGPGLPDLDNVSGVGEHVARLHAIYGSSEEQFAEACQRAIEAEGRKRRHIFVRKWWR